MKALKEKRVSLRSLFRRSLVILSLLALAFAFASCGDSGGGGGGGDTQPTNGTTPPPPPAESKYVEKLEIMKHPNTYSYEAGAPDITGLRVAVYWNDNGASSVQIIDVDGMDSEEAKLFYVDPPVASLPTGTSAGTNFTSLSTAWDYKLFYNGVSAAAPVNIYIPAVRALSIDGSSNSNYYIKLDGKIPAIYEDQPIDVSSLKLTANYVEIACGYGTWDDDEDDWLTAGTAFDKRLNTYGTNDSLVGQTGRKLKEFSWDGAKAGIESVPVSYSPTDQTIWLLTKDEKKPTKDSKLEYNPATAGIPIDPDTSAPKVYKAGVGAFYFVEKLQYLAGAQNLRALIGDEEEINGTVDWVKELTAANVRFKVIYYTGPDQELPEASREIGMSEYTKAMYSLDPKSNPRATLPVIRGAEANDKNKPVPNVPGETYDSNSILGVAIEEFFDDAVVQCFYYYPGIKAGDRSGEGYYDDTGEAGAKGSDEEVTSGRAWANAASVPLTGKIYQFDSIVAERKKNTDAIGDPEVLFGKEYPQSLINGLKRRWDVVYVYVDPNNSSKTINSDPIDWRDVTNSMATSALIPLPGTAGGWTNTDADPEDTDEVSVTFDLPLSAKAGGDFTDEIDFTYFVVN